MLILAIDTALDACAAGILDTDAGKLIALESQPMKRGHAEALMPLIAKLMKDSGIAFAGLDRIAVTTGPGSFTGLRVGLSAARGIALAASKPAVAVDPRPAPDIAWVAWLGAAVSPDTAPPRPFYLRAPDAKPSKQPPQQVSQPSAP